MKDVIIHRCSRCFSYDAEVFLLRTNSRPAFELAVSSIIHTQQKPQVQIKVREKALTLGLDDTHRLNFKKKKLPQAYSWCSTFGPFTQ